MEVIGGISDEDFNTLVLRLYHGVRNVPLAQFRDYALTLIKPVLDFDAAKWGMGIHDGRGTFISSIHLYQLPPEILADYAAAVGNNDPLAARIAAQFGRTVCSS